MEISGALIENSVLGPTDMAEILLYPMSVLLSSMVNGRSLRT